MDKVAKIAEESENNESSFIQNLCKELLSAIAKESQKLSNEMKAINMENPHGFPGI
mgnify:CR=1 FL=1